MSTPLVHVLVINWNGIDHLEACLSSLFASSYPNFRIVLIDNASTDDSLTYARNAFGADPRLEVLALEHNLGWSGGNNVGIRNAQRADADYVFLLNNDTWTAPDCIANLVKAAETAPDCAGLAPKMLLFDQPTLLNSVGIECSPIGGSWDRGIGRIDSPRWNDIREVLGICGGAMFLRTAALSDPEFLPEEFGIYLDDLDLCLRLRDAGWSLRSCPDAVVHHKFSATYGTGTRARHKYFLNTRNRLWLLLRNFPVATIFHTLPQLLIGECRAIARGMLDGEAWRAWAHVRAWGAALTYLHKARAARRRRTRQDMPIGTFLPMLNTQHQFCPRIVLPNDGFYPPVQHNGREYTPIARHAWTSTPGGYLRVFFCNCYPEAGVPHVRIVQHGTEIGQFHADTASHIDINTTPGKLEFHAETILTLENTGSLHDIGGWVAWKMLT